jgi:hypothetical protein
MKQLWQFLKFIVNQARENYSPISNRQMTFLFFFICIGVRVIIMVVLDFSSFSLGRPSPYSEALNSHFWTYLWNTSLIPPLNYIIDAFLVHFIGFNWWLKLPVIFFMDVVAAYLLFRASLLIGCKAQRSLLLAIFYSLALVPFELWWWGRHYDHLTIFFVSLFSFFVVKWIYSCSTKNSIYVSVSAALLILQSSVATYIVPMVLLISLFVNHKILSNWRSFLGRGILCFVLPIIAISFLMVKNYHHSGIMSSSTKGGPAIMMIVVNIYRDRIDELREFLVQNDIPDWYIYAFDNPVYPTDENGAPYKDWLKIHLSRSFGITMPWTKFEDTSWPYDFEPLHKFLVSEGEIELAKIVARDIYDTKHRKYLFQGSSPELSPRWISHYGKISTRIALKVLLSNPIPYMYQVLINQFRYSIRYPTYIETKALEINSLHSVIYYPLLAVTFFWSRMIQIVYLFTMLFIPIGTIFFVFPHLVKRKSKHISIFLLFTNPITLVLGWAIFLNAMIFSFGVGGENDRYFMQITPYLLIITMMLFSKKVFHHSQIDIAS